MDLIYNDNCCFLSLDPDSASEGSMATAAPINQIEHEQVGRAAGPCVMVMFGASGDLTKRKLVPALYNLARQTSFPRSLRWWE